MSDRKTDSKSNLNESTLPLLDDAEKEKIELKSAEKTEGTEAAAGAAAGATAEETAKAAEDAAEAAKKKKEEEKERKRQAKLAEEEKKKALKAEKAKKKEEGKGFQALTFGSLNFNFCHLLSPHRARAEEAEGGREGGGEEGRQGGGQGCQWRRQWLEHRRCGRLQQGLEPSEPVYRGHQPARPR